MKYEEIIFSSGIASPGLVKGTIFIYPKGWFIWERIQSFINKEYRSIGVRNVAFPSLIPLSEMEKEKENLSGFRPELFLVSKTGDKGSPSVFLRPTSEILFSHFFRKELHSYGQLPMLFNQWCNIFRSEKNTKTFLRNCEFYWQEAHTLHRTYEEAIDYWNKFHDIYKRLVKEELGLAVLEGEKTLNERFQGAERTLTLEAIMPDGQALQISTSHYLAKNFSEIFEVKYSNHENKLENPYQLSAGSSTRLIGAVVMNHSDETGLILPLTLSEVQIKILIVGDVVKPGDSIHKTIDKSLEDYRTEWEFSSKKSFGFRITDSEVAGIPIVIVIGDQELSKKQVMIKSRLKKEKEFVDIDKLKEHLKKISKEYSEDLYSRSLNNLNNSIVDLKEGSSLEEVKKYVLDEKKVVLVPWFDNEENEEKFKKEGLGFGPRCVKERIEKGDSKCFYSGEVANSYVYFGRSY